MIRGYEGIVTAFKGEPVVYVFDGAHAQDTPLGSVLYQRHSSAASGRRRSSPHAVYCGGMPDVCNEAGYSPSSAPWEPSASFQTTPPTTTAAHGDQSGPMCNDTHDFPR